LKKIQKNSEEKMWIQKLFSAILQNKKP
jgi:hypothetical protein